MISNASSLPNVSSLNEDEIDFLSLFDVLLEARWLIAGITAAALLLGGGGRIFKSACVSS